MILLEAAATTLQGPGEGGGPLDGYLIRGCARPARPAMPPRPALGRHGSRANPPAPSEGLLLQGASPFRGLPPQGPLPHGGAPPPGAHPLQGGGVPSNRLHHGGRWPCK